MLKILGILLFSCSVSAYGAYCSSNIKNATLIRLEILDFIKHIQSGIKYGNYPLEKLFKSFYSPMLKKCGFLDALTNGSSNINQISDKTLFLLKKEERDIFTEFLTGIGKSLYCEKELKRCDYYIEYFQEKDKDSKKNDEVRASLYKRLGVIAALMAVIILI